MKVTKAGWIAIVLIFAASLAMAAEGTATATAAAAWWEPYAKTALDALTTILIAWAAKKFSDKTGIDIEAKHREALHSAAMTGINSALAELSAPPDAARVAAVQGQLLDQAAAWVRKSVPDALTHFGLGTDPDSQAKLKKLIEGKLGELLKVNG